MATIWTQADVQELAAAVKSGILTVRYDGPPGRTVTYQSTEQMERLLAHMRAEVARENGTASYRLISTSKGL